MSRPLGKHLASSLLRAARSLGDGTLSLRFAPSGPWGSFNEDAVAGTRYQLDALEAAVPGLEELPSSFPLDRPSLSQLIKANFMRHKDAVVELSEGFTTLDQAFSALRALPEQLYLEECSSANVEDGIQVDVTSRWMDSQEDLSGDVKHIFTYRVRVTNGRSSSIQVLGRSWDIMDDAGALVGHIPLSPENGVVGQQPVVPPGCTFEYTSGSVLSSSSGRMRGLLAVAELKGLRPWRKGEEWFQVRVAPFKLMKPQGS